MYVAGYLARCIVRASIGIDSLLCKVNGSYVHTCAVHGDSSTATQSHKLCVIIILTHELRLHIKIKVAYQGLLSIIARS